MTKQEFSEIFFPVVEYYRADLPVSALELYYKQLSRFSARDLKAMIDGHMSDPGAGMFMPTYAHLLRNKPASASQFVPLSES